MTQWDWQLLRAGGFRLDGGSMFGVVPKALWSRMTDVDDANRIPLQTNCLLLDDHGGRRVLIETGYGNKWPDKERRIFALEDRSIRDAFAQLSIDPADITHVILSHLHFDHAGGLTHIDEGNADPVSSFPNAIIYTQQQEWDDALANRSTMTRTYLRSHLDPVADQIHCLDGEADVPDLPGIRVAPAPGHTWGQQMIMFDDEQGVVCFPGDCLPTRAHVGAAFSMGYDMEPYTNMQTKHAMLKRAVDEGWRLVLDHEPGEAVVEVAADEKGFALTPVRTGR